MTMFGRWRRGEGSEVQAIVDSAAVRLIVPVKYWSCSMGSWRGPDGDESELKTIRVGRFGAPS